MAHRAIAEVAQHLKNAEYATIKGGRRVHKLPRRSARSRELLPAPDQPAWAAVNRMPSRKVQMPCRVVPDIKKLIEDEAADAGVSQSRWLEEAIAEKLQRQGHPVYLPPPAKAPEKPPTLPRRTRRAALPELDKSSGSAANRADKVTTVRISKTLAAQIDKRRGRKARSVWLREAVAAFMEAGKSLPEPSDTSEALPVAVSVGFDHAVFAALDAFAAQAGLTRSEWMRRAAICHATDNE